MNKPLLYTLLVVILLAGGVWWGVTYYKNTNTTVQNTNGQVVVNTNTGPVVETTGWKTYQNSKYNYEFKYPHWWELADSMDSNIINPNASSVTFAEVNPHVQNRFSVTVKDPADCRTLAECANQNLTYEVIQSGQQLASTVIDDVEGLSVVLFRSGSGLWNYQYVYVLNDTKLFILTTIAQPDSTGTNDSVAQKIIDEFRFLTS